MSRESASTLGKVALAIVQGLILAGIIGTATMIMQLKVDVAVLKSNPCKCLDASRQHAAAAGSSRHD